MNTYGNARTRKTQEKLYAAQVAVFAKLSENHTNLFLV